MSAKTIVFGMCSTSKVALKKTQVTDVYTTGQTKHVPESIFLNKVVQSLGGTSVKFHTDI